MKFAVFLAEAKRLGTEIREVDPGVGKGQSQREPHGTATTAEIEDARGPSGTPVAMDDLFDERFRFGPWNECPAIAFEVPGEEGLGAKEMGEGTTVAEKGHIPIELRHLIGRQGPVWPGQQGGLARLKPEGNELAQNPPWLGQYLGQEGTVAVQETL